MQAGLRGKESKDDVHWQGGGGKIVGNKIIITQGGVSGLKLDFKGIV